MVPFFFILMHEKPKPPGNIFTDRSKALLLLWITCVLCFSCILRLFIAAVWSPAGKGLTSWLLLVMLLFFCYLPMWYPGSGVVLDCIVS